MDQTDSPTPGETPQPPPNPTGNGFFGWLRGLRITRSTDDRWFTGVAGGIAARAGIDPLIVRGIFVVLTILGGSGGTHLPGGVAVAARRDRQDPG